jgi:hypothetical protein
MKKTLLSILGEGFTKLHDKGQFYLIMEKKYQEGYSQRLLYDKTNDSEITRWTITPSDKNELTGERYSK